MKKETRQKILKMINNINDCFPSKEHGYAKIYKIKLVEDRIELYSIDYSKTKRGVAKKEYVVFEEKEKSMYAWEDMLQALLIGCGLPIHILRQFQQIVAEKFKNHDSVPAKNEDVN